MTSQKKSKVKHGVRIFQVSENTLLIKQTIKKGSNTNDPYVIDGQKECHAKLTDDLAIANAVRDGIAGKLKS